eukprot:jgi/Mesen1/8541/ME000484S07939
MVGSNLRAEALTLMEKRESLETEIEVITSRLCGPGGPGLTAAASALATPAGASEGAGTRAAAVGAAGVGNGPQPLRPFAVIDEVSPGSPAEADGVQLGDQLLCFGSVTAGPSCIQQVAQVLQSSQGQAVNIVALRRGERCQLSVTPRTWPGRGLLG